MEPFSSSLSNSLQVLRTVTDSTGDGFPLEDRSWSQSRSHRAGVHFIIGFYWPPYLILAERPYIERVLGKTHLSPGGMSGQLSHCLVYDSSSSLISCCCCALAWDESCKSGRVQDTGECLHEDRDHPPGVLAWRVFCFFTCCLCWPVLISFAINIIVPRNGSAGTPLSAAWFHQHSG